MLGDFPRLVRVGANCHVCLHRKVRRPSNEEEDRKRIWTCGSFKL